MLDVLEAIRGVKGCSSQSVTIKEGAYATTTEGEFSLCCPSMSEALARVAETVDELGRSGIYVAEVWIKPPPGLIGGPTHVQFEVVKYEPPRWETAPPGNS